MGKAHAAFKRCKEAAVLFETVKKLAGELRNEKFSGELAELLVNLEENSEIELACAKANFVLEQVMQNSLNKCLLLIFKRLNLKIIYVYSTIKFLLN